MANHDIGTLDRERFLNSSIHQAGTARYMQASVVAILLALSFLGAGASVGAEPPPPSEPPSDLAIGETLRVTSVEILVGTDRGGKLREWATGKRTSGSRLRPEEIEVRLGDAIAQATVSDRRDPVGQPPRIVLFFDAPTSDQTSYRWAAAQLAAEAGTLTAWGEVQVVLGDPEPRAVLGPTRDAAQLEALLSNTSLFARIEDSQVAALREEFAALSEGTADEEHIERLAAHFAQTEERLIVQRQDVLLDHLDRLDGGIGPVRLLVYVSQGFDRSPRRFYGLEAVEPSAAERAFDGWLRSLAGYGWTCLPLVYEDRRALLRGGLRIGKWRFRWTSKSEQEEERLRAFREPFGAVREAERDPKKADAYAQLARSELEAGAFEAAAEHFLRAIHHYYYDPRTSARQAAAWLGLSRALRGSRDLDGARAAAANALELDPSLAQSTGVELVLEDSQVLTDMARESGGWVLESARDLALALAEIGRRQSLRFDLPAVAYGASLPLVIDAPETKGTLRHVRWVRKGTPLRMAQARLRTFVEQQREEPASGGEWPIVVRDTDGSRTVFVDEVPSLYDRVLLGMAVADGPVQVIELEPASGADDSGFWQGGGLAGPDETVTAALYLESLATGDWRSEPVWMSPSPR